MTSEARLLAFESWMDAAMRGSDWFAPLRCSAKLLGARTAAIVWKDSDASAPILSASPEAEPRFLRLCADLAGAHGNGIFERDEPGLGRIAWTKVQANTPPPVGDLAFFALFDGAADPVLLRDIAGVAASSISAKARLSAVSATSALKTAAFDQLPFGVVIVDRQIRIAERNQSCRQLLARSDGLSVVHEKLLCREPSDQAALYKAINRALVGDANAGVVKVRRARGAQPYVVRVVAPRHDAGAREHCLLMIVDPDEEPLAGCDIWRAMFDLTDCELIIAEGLVSGRRINDIANQRGVSVETVRTQTKRMFERLNVSSQAEATARLSRTAPFRSANQPRRGVAEVA